MKAFSLFLTAAFVLANVNIAVAAFNNGIETFPGTVKDTVTWGQSALLHTEPAFVQNNALIYDQQGLYGSASYNTRQQTVAWGESVRMTTSLTSASAGISLLLTNNSVGADDYGSYSSAFWGMGLWTNPNPAFNRVTIGAGSNGAWGDGDRGVFVYEPIVNHQYVLQITPLSASSALFTLLDSDGLTTIESILYDNSPISVPDNLHISIFAAGGSAIVESIAIVPEPSAIAMACFALLATPVRRYR